MDASSAEGRKRQREEVPKADDDLSIKLLAIKQRIDKDDVLSVSETVSTESPIAALKLPRTYLMQPFVPNQEVYEAGLEHARKLARASRARKRESVEKSRIRTKEFLIEREQYYQLLASHDIPSAPTGSSATFSLSSLDASELLASLQNMDEQEHQLIHNKQRITDIRGIASVENSGMSEEHLEILRKDRNRIHAKKARLKRKIIAQELQAIERKLDEELSRLRQYVILNFPSGVPELPELVNYPASLTEALDKIDSLAKYGDVLVTAVPERTAALMQGHAVPPRVPSIPIMPPMNAIGFDHNIPPVQPVFVPAMYGYQSSPPVYPNFYPPSGQLDMFHDPIWSPMSGMMHPGLMHHGHQQHWQMPLHAPQNIGGVQYPNNYPPIRHIQPRPDYMHQPYRGDSSDI